jgi:hypothetical protein
VRHGTFRDQAWGGVVSTSRDGVYSARHAPTLAVPRGIICTAERRSFTASAAESYKPCSHCTAELWRPTTCAPDLWVPTVCRRTRPHRTRGGGERGLRNLRAPASRRPQALRRRQPDATPTAPQLARALNQLTPRARPGRSQSSATLVRYAKPSHPARHGGRPRW